MTRVKKTRKPGSSGSRAATRNRSQEAGGRDRKQSKKHKGRPAGNRQASVAVNQSRVTQKKLASDGRVGSRKPVLLQMPHAQEAEVSRSPTEIIFPELPVDPELAMEFIEEDAEFNRLADLIDDGAELEKTEQTLFDWFVEQHRQLVEQLSLVQNDAEQTTETERDLLQELEQGEEWLQQHRSEDKH